ncbi:MAG TPA: pyridoxal-phosphate dependent enzyme, partial [Hyphomicrobiaceae bacterium]|nr:pyridoxal-phosphate dependent enzyme [Hyphomicrobiaceae bacterium]
MTKDVFQCMGALPRIALIHGPTPLIEAPRLSERLGAQLAIKRDDLTPIGAGGNKLRKLEFIMAKVLSQGATSVVTTGGVQSNHARLTAAVAARLGLKCYLRLKGQQPAAPSGNVLLDHLFGADLDYWDLPNYEAVNLRMADFIALHAAGGEKTCAIPLGGATAEGTLGYALAFSEICEQMPDRLPPDYIVLAAGTGSTQAGLLLGAKLSGAGTRILGVSVSWSRAVLVAEVTRHVSDAASHLGISVRLDPSDVWIEDGYVGDGYGRFSAAGRSALELTAQLEGVLLDSTYTAKAMSGLIGEVGKTTIPK